jgi:branched-chain amino acid transport system substrate-binding protein
MKKSQCVLGVAGGLLLLSLITGCGKQSGEAKHKILIGAIYPLTGPVASLGIEFQRGAEIALATAPQETQDRVQLLVEDGKADAQASISSYQKLRASGAKIFLTTVSSVGLSLESLTSADGCLLFADVAHPAITGRSKLTFRHSSTAVQEARIVSTFLQKNGAGKTSLVWVNDDYGASFKKEFENITHAIPGSASEYSYPKTDTDLRSVVVRSLDDTPENIVVIGYGKQLGNLIQRIREQGFTGRIISSMGFTVTPDAVTAAGASAEGVYYTCMSFHRDDPSYKVFETEYLKRYSTPPPDYALLALNSMKTILSAIGSGANDPQAISAWIYSQTNLVGTGETMDITLTGDILPPVEVRQYHK